MKMTMIQKIQRTACAAALLAVLTACGCWNGGEADVVFVNGAQAAVSAALLDGQDRSGRTRNADSSPLDRGESFGFEAGEYPVTVAVYARPVNGGVQQEPLAVLTISEAPAEGDRWYVTARDGADGLTLEAGSVWPEGV